ncbi:hypothetical protein Hanom_Chr08g00685661 [Helianthus anomalus]
MIINTLKLKKKYIKIEKKVFVKNQTNFGPDKLLFQLLSYFDPSCILLSK